MIENNLQKTEITNNFNLPGLSKESEGFLCQIVAPALIAGSEFLVTKFRLATFNTICEYANKIAQDRNVEIKPTPPKFLLPFIEKASLETEDTDLQKEWAKLLVAAGKNYNPIHLQYAEILSQIGGDESRLLKKIFEHQKKDKFGKYCAAKAANSLEEYETMCNVAHTADEISSKLQVGESVDMGEGEYMFHNASIPDIHINVDFPERPVLEDFLFEIDYSIYSENTITGLERLNLAKVFYEANNNLIALTEFGYKFIATLEGIDNVST